MNKLWRNAGLYALLAIVAIAIGTTFFNRQPPAEETWKYSQFLEEVRRGNVQKVAITNDRTRAIVQKKNGDKVQISLVPGDLGLLKTLEEKKVDVFVLPP